MRLKDASLHNSTLENGSSYDSVAHEFDRFVARFSPPVVRRIIGLAELRPSDHVLDVGTGTGIVAFYAAANVHPSGKVTAIDLSEGMLAAARSKAEREGLSDRIRFVRMDAEKLELPSHSVDVVLSLYALLHFPRPDVALAEMFRVLRPGGRLVVAIGSGPPPFSAGAVKSAVRRVRDLIQAARRRQLVACDCLDEFVRTSIPELKSVQDHHREHQHRRRTAPLRTLVRAAGFVRVRQEWRGHRWVIDTPDEFWRLQATFSTFSRKRLAVVSPADLQALRDEFVNMCGNVIARGGQLIYRTGTLLVSGHRM
jgi:ubiquinone/menaquinone biosynthesis C-methylase UbiE